MYSEDGVEVGKVDAVVDNYRDPLSEIVSETIESWDAAATSRRIELRAKVQWRARSPSVLNLELQ